MQTQKKLKLQTDGMKNNYEYKTRTIFGRATIVKKCIISNSIYLVTKLYPNKQAVTNFNKHVIMISSLAKHIQQTT